MHTQVENEGPGLPLQDMAYLSKPTCGVFPDSLRASQWFPLSLLGSLSCYRFEGKFQSVSNINTRWSPHSRWFITLEMFSVTCFKTESHEIRLSIFLLFPKTHFSARVSMAHFFPWQYRINHIPSDHSPGRPERVAWFKDRVFFPASACRIDIWTVSY